MDLSALGLGDVVKGNGLSSADVQPEFVSGNTYKVTWISMKKKEYKGKVFYEACLIASTEHNGNSIFINIRADYEVTEGGIKFDEYGSKRFQKLYKAYGVLPDDGSLPIFEFDTVEKIKTSIIGERNSTMKAKITAKEGSTEGKFWYSADQFIYDESTANSTPGVTQTADTGSGMPNLGEAADDLPF